MEVGKHYVVGFMFNRTRGRVVLVYKNRPAWQAGLLNGVGGKVELGETPAQAMAREFYEEAGVNTRISQWEHFVSIQWADDSIRTNEAVNSRVDFFRCVSEVDTLNVFTRTDEHILVIRMADRDSLPMIPNLRWLLPLAAYTADRYEPFIVTATCMEA